MKAKGELIQYFAIAITFTWLFRIPDGFGKGACLPIGFGPILVFPEPEDPWSQPWFLLVKRKG